MNNHIIKYFFVIILTMFSVLASADPAEGTYKRITPPLPTQSDGKIEVIEIFWYGCPHCFALEPYIEDWLKNIPEDVEFRRIPGVLNKSWLPHARAYFTAEKLGVLDKIHKPLFEALHKKRRRIFSENELRDFFIEQGVSGADFSNNYNSNEVEIKVKQAFFTARRSGTTGVPVLIVNGKYLTSGSLTGSYENLLHTVDQLIDNERRAL